MPTINLRPERKYPVDVGHPYPDHSRELKGGVLRAFRYKGEQMWDEDMNNVFKWINLWMGRWAHYREVPRHPYYTPTRRLYLIDDRWYSGIHWDDEDPDYPHAIYFENPGEDNYLYPFQGAKCSVVADRTLVCFGNSGWKILCYFQEFRDIIEIAMFCSETRRGRSMFSYRVERPFRLPKGTAVRTRNYPFVRPDPEVYRNGVFIGWVVISQFSSRISFESDTVFEVGDLLEFRCPDNKRSGIYRGVSITIVGELI